jgi:hypothetical protein
LPAARLEGLVEAALVSGAPATQEPAPAVHTPASPAAVRPEGSAEAALGAQLAEQVKLIGQLLEQQRQDELHQQQQQQLEAASPQQLAVLQQAADALFSPGESCLWVPVLCA